MYKGLLKISGEKEKTSKLREKWGKKAQTIHRKR